MTAATTYELVLRGNASARILRPLLDDFAIDHSTPGCTRLVGPVLDACQLHGLLAHLTSVGVELVSLCPVPLPDTQLGQTDSRTDSHTDPTFGAQA